MALISLDPIEKIDLTCMMIWRNSPSVYPYVREYRLLNEHDQEKWYESYLSSRRKSDFDQDINILVYDDIPIGVCGLTRIEWKNRKGELTFYIGDDEYRKESVIIKSITYLLNHYFSSFGLHKITWPVYSHDPNIAAYAKVMPCEAILKDEYWWNNKFNDRIYLSKINSA